MYVKGNINDPNVGSSAQVSRSLTMLDETGDTTITWQEAEDEAMLRIIDAKMAAGVVFYIVPARKPGQRGRLAAPKPLKDAAEARKHRALSIKDADFSKFVLEGHGDAVLSKDLEPVEKKQVKRAKTAREVASGHSVGVRARAGG